MVSCNKEYSMRKKFYNKRCIIAGLFSAKDKEFQTKIEQVKTQLNTFGGVVVDNIIQRRGVSRAKKPGGAKHLNEPLNAKYIFSKGKLQQLIDLANSANADFVIFYNSLNSTQRSALKHVTKCKIISYSDDIQENKQDTKKTE